LKRSGEPPAPLLARFDEIEVTVEKLVAGGDGLARHEGLPIFVPRSAPGDRLRVRVSERRPSYARAEILDVLEPGPGRREPPCRHFGECGGCDLQHLEDEYQLEAKVAATVETLARLARLELPEPRVLAGDAWAYRTRARLHAKRTAASDGPGLGYYARGTHEVIAVEECPVLVPELESVVRRLPATLSETGSTDGDQLLNEPFLVQDVARRETKDGRPFLLETFRDKTGQVSGVFWDVPPDVEDWIRPGRGRSRHESGEQHSARRQHSHTRRRTGGTCQVRHRAPSGS
jgi:tRNA/tmRNA/rRNA uracil-C5-methylase (TrmA/RlmC/RlmD family)